MQTLPSYREILKIALPMMIGSLSETISSVVDTAFMGQLGTIEMDAMGMTNVFLLLIFMVGWSYGRGSQIIISQNLGAENYGNIGKAFGNSLLFLLPVSILLAIYLYYGSESVLKFIITNPAIHSVSFVIIQIRALGLPFLMTSVVISSLYTGLGKTKILIFSQGLAAVSNMILNYCLVFGHFGFPELGFEGSA
ncbi:MAG: MATE family efflux transporter, partial [Chitinophagales bacterium]